MCVRPLFVVLAMELIATGCNTNSDLMDGPRPTLMQVVPNILCVAQADQQITIEGDGLAPLILDAAKDEPKVLLPQVYLQHAKDLEGKAILPDDGSGPKPSGQVEEKMVAPEDVQWQSQRSMILQIRSALDLAPGVYRVRIKNGSGQETTLSDAFTVVPPPQISKVEPDLACTAQEMRSILISGQGFLNIVGELPVVQFGTVALQASQASDCRPLPAPTDAVQICSTLQIQVPIAGVSEGLWPVKVINPSPAGCESIELVNFLVVPPPTILSIEPDLACVAQEEKQFVLSGTGFLEVNGQLPTVQISDTILPTLQVSDCTDLVGLSYPVRSCSVLSVAVPAGGVQPGLQPVAVTNPPSAGCSSEEEIRLLIVPPPALETVEPDLLCLEQNAVTLRFLGSGFIDNNGVLPTIKIGDLSMPATGVEDCSMLEGPVGTVRSCLVLTLTLGQGAFQPGPYSVFVTNPPEADCASTEAVALAVVAGPVVSDTVPELFCAEQASVDVTVSGSGFLKVNDQLPVVLVGTESFIAKLLQNCVAVEGTLQNAESCQELVFTMDAKARQTGWQDLKITNPIPADCEIIAASQFFLTGAPDIDSVSPTVACEINPVDFSITGSQFLELGGVPPTVTIQGQAATVISIDGCSDVANLTATRLCTEIHAQVATAVPQGEYSISVQNPGSRACSTDTVSYLGPPPEITSIQPLRLCASGGLFTINGDHFVDGSVVSIQLQERDVPLNTTYQNAQTLTATLPDMSAPGLYDVTVTNPDGCAGMLAAILDVTPMPVVYFVDPSVIYNGINLQVTVYTSGILGAVNEVGIVPTGQGGDPILLEYNATDNSKIQAVIPSGLAATAYDIRVVDDIGCVGELLSGVTVVEELTVALDRVELPFGWKDGRTGVNVYAPETPDAGMSNFRPTPRFYLNPKEAGSNALASELKHTAFASVTRCSAVVPSGLPVGLYDLIAQNPDGGVGLLVDAFRITELEPPMISEVTPASVVNQDTQTIKVLGKNFRTPVFEATCHQPDSVVKILPGTIDTNASSDTLLVVSLNFTAMTIADNSLCIVKVQNSDDQTYALYSALGVTNLSLNLGNFQDTAKELGTARRALCVVSGDPTPGARFVYAIGGDNGTTQSSEATERYDTIEAASVDPYGSLSDWIVLPYRLPSAVAFHSCATIGRYIFVAGGRGEPGSLASVWRSKVLDPLEAPEIVDLDLYIDPDQSTVLLPGRYAYRISAIRPNDDSENPGGETLASDPIQVQTPAIEQKVSITIAWTQVQGAVGYRIYRTPDPDLSSGSEQLLSQVGAGQLVFTDDGSLQPQSEQPLPAGALGKFFILPNLNTPREGAGISVARDPSDPTIRYLYLLGGQNATIALDTVERLRLVIDGVGHQTIDSLWVDGLATIGPARWQLQAFVANHLSAPELLAEADSWVYAGGGLTASLDKDPSIIALRVETGGTLGEIAGNRYTVDTMQPFNAGYVGYLLNHQLFVFGGNQGAGTDPSSESFSVEMCGSSVSPGSGACSGTIPDPPDTANWNSVGINLAHARYLHGGVTTSAFIFLVGGITLDGQAVVTASSEKTLW